MNEKSQPDALQGLEEAPASFTSDATSASDLRADELRGRDLRGRDLTRVEGLLPEHLAGADLTRAKLPPEIEKFPALEQVKAISGEARKVFIGLLAACVYSWLVIGKTHDVELILDTAGSPLPIINTPIPTGGFYVVGAALLAAVYCYLHFYLQRLWRTLATLPAIFPDGVALDDKTDPWLLTNLVRTEFMLLRPNAPPLARLENLLAVFLIWWLVPLTLLALWARYLPAHGSLGTSWLVFLIGLATLFGRHTYRLARVALRGQTSRTAQQTGGDGGILARAWREFRGLRPDKLTVWLTIGLGVCSISAFRDNPRAPHTWVAKGLNAFDFVGIRTYANLREVEVAQKPEGWDGKDWNKIKRVDLKGRNLAFADGTRSFLANADLRGAILTGAILDSANLQGADFFDEDLDRRPARLLGANLQNAQLLGADLREALLPGVNLQGAQLQDANLYDAQLQGANLQGAQLQDANLYDAQLQGANLQNAQLPGADLRNAQLLGANLHNAQLQNADLQRAELQNADLGDAQLQRAKLNGAQLQGADASGAGFQNAALPTAQLQATMLRSARLNSADLSGANLVVADLQQADLQGAELPGARLQGADLFECKLQGANLLRAQLQGADLSRAHLQGADLRYSGLQGASLDWAELQGVDLRDAALWPDVVPQQASAWFLADVRSSYPQPISPGDLDHWINTYRRSIESIPEPRRGLIIARLRRALANDNRPAMPNLPGTWDTWATIDAYDEDLARFLGDLACGAQASDDITFGLARRAVNLAYGEPERMWLKLFAARVTGPDCPPAKGLPEDMRKQLEQLAAQSKPSKAPEATAPGPS